MVKIELQEVDIPVKEYPSSFSKEINEEMAALKREDYTCYKCPLKDNCKYAWDIYNIKGHCLAGK